ncbi:hypothetical protein BDV96DRAFT_500800 [Lophiotrema nucula]|uniref:Short-chain dehydrogenase n=1 Tax=Lophiotrema nucula TaxID=690887 RepID=A0A6A5YUP7_9PLEO|nr:hypothetical protein BDV96DRAFT_500800 [Lophiotrema nucula]
MAAKQVALILGAGPRVGGAVASKFASLNYSVAVASRKGTGSLDSNGHLSLQADFSKPDTVAPLFEQVKAQFGAAPSVVVYNAAALTPPSDPANVLSISQDSFVKDININTVSPYVAAQEAVKGFASLPEGLKKSFIYTGNILNTVVFPVPVMLTLGVGKSASAYWIGVADALHKDKGYRFFYADERYGDGKLKGQDLDGDAHAEFFAQLASDSGSIPWHATFAKDKGYVKW